jgi:hypothetical protein
MFPLCACIGRFCCLAQPQLTSLYSFCNFNDMRDLFWSSIVPISKAEITSKGVLSYSVDTPRKDKEEWVIFSHLTEGPDTMCARFAAL